MNGFWELLKILLLDFSVLAGIQFFGRAPLPKALAAVFCGFGVAFAALAAGKLAVYVTLCALTPRRFTAAWCLFVLAVCAVLALVRVIRYILRHPQLSLWTITTLAVVAFGLVEALFMNSVFLKINDVSFIFWLALGALMLETEDKAPAAERTL